jgi:hypothetical protein
LSKLPKKSSKSPFSTFSFINRFIHYMSVFSEPAKQKPGGVPPFARWMPPSLGMTKVTVDVALSKNGGMSSVSRVIGPEIMEAAARREGLA